MITIDYRTGSGELTQYLAQLKLPVEVATLQFGDFMFWGRGEGEEPIPVAIERKALDDFISSAMHGGRLAGHQLTGLLLSYRVVYIVIEGLFKTNYDTGRIQTLQGKKWVDFESKDGKVVMARELEATVLTLENKGGMLFRRTTSKMDTCHFIKHLYRWWTDKAFDEHKSHLKFHSSTADPQLLVKPSLCRQVAATLPGIGWTKSGAVASHFGSVYSMAQAPESEWVKIPGIGKLGAQKILAALQGTKIVL